MNKKILYKITLLEIITLLIITSFNCTLADEAINTIENNIITQNSSAITTINEPTISSYAGILMDAKTGQIIYEHNSNEKLYPASTTKLMTAILTLENCNLTDKVTVSNDALNGIPLSYTTAQLKAGEQLTVEQLLNVLLIPSANDAANVLAYHIAGSIDKFSDLMNAKAQELGTKNTHFVNPSGIHDENHYSTAYDMSLIGKYANTFETIKNIASTTEYSLPDLPNGTERKFKSTNNLINKEHKAYYEYANGLKTGYTDPAKSCIVATAKKNDIELICGIFGGEKIDNKNTYRDLDCHTLFDYGFNNFSYKTICSNNNLLDLSSCENIPENLNEAEITYSENLNLLVDKNNEIKPIITWQQDLQLPISKNTVVGTITYNICGTPYTVNLIAKNNIYLPIQSNINIQYLMYALIIFFAIILFSTVLRKKGKHRFHQKSRSSKGFNF